MAKAKPKPAKKKAPRAAKTKPQKPAKLKTRTTKPSKKSTKRKALPKPRAAPKKNIPIRKAAPKAKPVKKAAKKAAHGKAGPAPKAAPKMELIKESPKVEMLPHAPEVPLLAPPQEGKKPEAPAPKAAPVQDRRMAEEKPVTAKPAEKPPASAPAPPEPAQKPPASVARPPEQKQVPKPLPPIEPEISPILPEPAEAEKPEAVTPKPPPPAVEAPAQPKPPEPPRPQAGGIRPLAPALELLPDWEDRLRLRRVIFEDGLQFFLMGKGTSEFDEAYILLNQTHKLPHSDLGDYFLICAKDRSGKVIAAIDGHAVSDELLVIGRSYSGHAKKRELHVLLYAAALSGRNPSFIACYTKLGDFSVETAGRLIFLGRGLGMSAIPLKTTHLIFVRRMRKELNPLSSGAEIAGILERLKVFGELELDGHIEEFRQKASVALVPLPTSPDSREHLHELKDAVSVLGLPADQLDAVMASLRADYVSGRKDITPEAL